MCGGTYEPHPFYYVCCNSYYGFISRKKYPFQSMLSVGRVLSRLYATALDVDIKYRDSIG